MKQHGRRHDDVFLVRIWSEPEEVHPNSWRAAVTHLATNKRRYFTNYAELCFFLEARRRER
jgi:hypothetical protein